MTTAAPPARRPAADSRHDFAATAAALADQYIDRMERLRTRLGELLSEESAATHSPRHKLLRGEEQKLREDAERLARIISPELTAGGLDRSDELLLTVKLAELESALRWTQDFIQRGEIALSGFNGQAGGQEGRKRPGSLFGGPR